MSTKIVVNNLNSNNKNNTSRNQYDRTTILQSHRIVSEIIKYAAIRVTSPLLCFGPVCGTWDKIVHNDDKENNENDKTKTTVTIGAAQAVWQRMISLSLHRQVPSERHIHDAAISSGNDLVTPSSTASCSREIFYYSVGPNVFKAFKQFLYRASERNLVWIVETLLNSGCDFFLRASASFTTDVNNTNDEFELDEDDEDDDENNFFCEQNGSNHHHCDNKIEDDAVDDEDDEEGLNDTSTRMNSFMEQKYSSYSHRPTSIGGMQKSKSVHFGSKLLTSLNTTATATSNAPLLPNNNKNNNNNNNNNLLAGSIEDARSPPARRPTASFIERDIENNNHDKESEQHTSSKNEKRNSPKNNNNTKSNNIIVMSSSNTNFGEFVHADDDDFEDDDDDGDEIPQEYDTDFSFPPPPVSQGTAQSARPPTKPNDDDEYDIMENATSDNKNNNDNNKSDNNLHPFFSQYSSQDNLQKRLSNASTGAQTAAPHYEGSGTLTAMYHDSSDLKGDSECPQSNHAMSPQGTASNVNTNAPSLDESKNDLTKMDDDEENNNDNNDDNQVKNSNIFLSSSSPSKASQSLSLQQHEPITSLQGKLFGKTSNNNNNNKSEEANSSVYDPTASLLLDASSSTLFASARTLATSSSAAAAAATINTGSAATTEQRQSNATTTSLTRERLHEDLDSINTSQGHYSTTLSGGASTTNLASLKNAVALPELIIFDHELHNIEHKNIHQQQRLASSTANSSTTSSPNGGTIGKTNNTKNKMFLPPLEATGVGAVIRTPSFQQLQIQNNTAAGLLLTAAFGSNQSDESESTTTPSSSSKVLSGSLTSDPSHNNINRQNSGKMMAIGYGFPNFPTSDPPRNQNSSSSPNQKNVMTPPPNSSVHQLDAHKIMLMNNNSNSHQQHILQQTKASSMIVVTKPSLDTNCAFYQLFSGKKQQPQNHYHHPHQHQQNQELESSPKLLSDPSDKNNNVNTVKHSKSKLENNNTNFDESVVVGGAQQHQHIYQNNNDNSRQLLPRLSMREQQNIQNMIMRQSRSTSKANTMQNQLNGSLRESTGAAVNNAGAHTPIQNVQNNNNTKSTQSSNGELPSMKMMMMTGTALFNRVSPSREPLLTHSNTNLITQHSPSAMAMLLSASTSINQEKSGELPSQIEFNLALQREAAALKMLQQQQQNNINSATGLRGHASFSRGATTVSPPPNFSPNTGIFRKRKSLTSRLSHTNSAVHNALLPPVNNNNNHTRRGSAPSAVTNANSSCASYPGIGNADDDDDELNDQEENVMSQQQKSGDSSFGNNLTPLSKQHQQHVPHMPANFVSHPYILQHQQGGSAIFQTSNQIPSLHPASNNNNHHQIPYTVSASPSAISSTSAGRRRENNNNTNSSSQQNSHLRANTNSGSNQHNRDSLSSNLQSSSINSNNNNNNNNSGGIQVSNTFSSPDLLNQSNPNHGSIPLVASMQFSSMHSNSNNNLQENNNNNSDNPSGILASQRDLLSLRRNLQQQQQQNNKPSHQQQQNQTASSQSPPILSEGRENAVTRTNGGATMTVSITPKNSCSSHSVSPNRSLTNPQQLFIGSPLKSSARRSDPITTFVTEIGERHNENDDSMNDQQEESFINRQQRQFLQRRGNETNAYANSNNSNSTNQQPRLRLLDNSSSNNRLNSIPQFQSSNSLVERYSSRFGAVIMLASTTDRDEPTSATTSTGSGMSYSTSLNQSNHNHHNHMNNNNNNNRGRGRGGNGKLLGGFGAKNNNNHNNQNHNNNNNGNARQNKAQQQPLHCVMHQNEDNQKMVVHEKAKKMKITGFLSGGRSFRMSDLMGGAAATGDDEKEDPLIFDLVRNTGRRAIVNLFFSCDCASITQLGSGARSLAHVCCEVDDLPTLQKFCEFYFEKVRPSLEKMSRRLSPCSSANIIENNKDAAVGGSNDHRHHDDGVVDSDSDKEKDHHHHHQNPQYYTREEFFVLLFSHQSLHFDSPLLVAAQSGSVECLRWMVETAKSCNKVAEFLRTAGKDRLGTTVLHEIVGGDGAKCVPGPSGQSPFDKVLKMLTIISTSSSSSSSTSQSPAFLEGIDVNAHTLFGSSPLLYFVNCIPHTTRLVVNQKRMFQNGNNNNNNSLLENLDSRKSSSSALSSTQNSSSNNILASSSSSSNRVSSSDVTSATSATAPSTCIFTVDQEDSCVAQIVEFLIERGADPLSQNLAGDSPLSVLLAREDLGQGMRNTVSALEKGLQ